MEQGPGSWSKFECLTPEDKAVFDAVKMPLGVAYEPVAVKRQLVSGMNYDFLCNAKVVYPDAQWYLATVLVYKPLDADPVVVKINKCEC